MSEMVFYMNVAEPSDWLYRRQPCSVLLCRGIFVVHVEMPENVYSRSAEETLSECYATKSLELDSGMDPAGKRKSKKNGFKPMATKMACKIEGELAGGGMCIVVGQ